MSPKIRFYLDEHVANAVARGLRVRGVDVLTVAEAGMRGAEDEEHLRLAASQGRAIFTQDDDFLRLHAQGVGHAGVIYARQRASVGDIVRGLVLVYQVLEPEDLVNRLEFL